MTPRSRPTLVPELTCRDAAASRAFYVDVLGFSVLYDRPAQGFFYLTKDGAELMIEQASDASWMTGSPDDPVGHGVHFQIMTHGIDDLHQRCRDAGVTIFRELEDAWYRADDHYVGQRQFVILDPDGFMLRFAEPLGTRATPPSSGRTVT